MSHARPIVVALAAATLLAGAAPRAASPPAQLTAAQFLSAASPIEVVAAQAASIASRGFRTTRANATSTPRPRRHSRRCD